MTKEEFIEVFLIELDKLSVSKKRIKSGKYILLSTLQRILREKNMCLFSFFSLIDKKSKKDSFSSLSPPLLLEDLVRTIEFYRKEKRISKRELSRRVNVEWSNFLKLYNRGLKSCNTALVLSLIYALEVYPSVFIRKALELRRSVPSSIPGDCI